MTEYRSLLERAGSNAPPSDLPLERILRRRDRKRRNQRIAAGVVGIAVFVAAVWIVTSVGSLDRSETSIGPAGDVTGPAETGPAETGPAETGPAETGPTETGPTETGPVIDKTGDPSSVGFDRLPPEGATPSKPLHGELVMKEGTGNSTAPGYYVNVYADGRLIWSRSTTAPRWIEQRLTPEGVELLRSGAVPLGGQFDNPAKGLPASAWEDRTLRPFVPWRYHACLQSDPSSQVLEFLPAEAKDILRRSPRTDATVETPCREMTLEDARVLVEILSDAGFEFTGPGLDPGGFYMATDPNGNQPPTELGIMLFVVLPHGSSRYGYAF